MDPLPLMPKSNVKPSSDISHVIREVFQDVLEEEPMEMHIAENLAISCADDMDIKENVIDMKKAHNDHHIILEDIVNIEEKIISIYADHLLYNDVIKDDEVIFEKLKLKWETWNQCFSKESVDKYNLIQSDDLLPPLHEQALDFQLDKIKDLYNKNVEMEENDISKILKKSIPTFPPLKPTRSLNRSQKIKEPRKKSSSTSLRERRSTLKLQSVIFKAEPDCVAFINYEMGVIYEKYFLLRNVSNTVGRFNIVPLSKNSKFHIEWNSLSGNTRIVASGLNFRIKVRFYTDSLENVTEQLTISVHEGKRVFVTLIAYREAPQLKVIELKDVEENQMTDREKALCTTIECGQCFLGETLTTTIRLHNNGEKARFWIISEQDWCTMNLKDISCNNTMVLPPFWLTPSYFSVIKDAIIDINIKYLPLEYGLQVEKLYVICDNCNFRELEILGDGFCYEDYFILIKDIPKVFQIDQEDDYRAQHFLDLGKSPPTGKVKGAFIVSNNRYEEFIIYPTSVQKLKLCIKMFYTWQTRRPKIKYTSENVFFDLSEEEFYVTPDMGYFQPFSTETFTVYCSTKEAKTGHYRHILQLYIKNLPEECISESCHPLEIVRTKNSTSDTNTVDILVNEVEIWLEIVPNIITLEPCVISIAGNKLRCGDPPIIRNVTMYNKSDFLLKCVWKNIEYSKNTESNKSCLLTLIPSEFSAYPRSCTTIVLNIVAINPGKTFGKFRCVINDGEKVLELAVEVEVEGPIVSLSTHMLDFGIVTQGTLAEAFFTILNETPIATFWRIQEYGYHLNRRKFTHVKHCNLSTENGLLPYKGRFSDVQYYLNTKEPHTRGSLICLSAVSADYNIPCQEYVLVLGTVKTPALCIKAPPKLNSILAPHGALYVGCTVQYTVILKNLTRLSTSFMWDEPIGHDANKLKVCFDPVHDTIPGAGSMKVKVIITPLEKGCVSHYYIPCHIGNEQETIILSIEAQVLGFNVTFQLPLSPKNCEQEDESSIMEDIAWPPKVQVFSRHFAKQKFNVFRDTSMPFISSRSPIPRPAINLKPEDVILAGFSSTHIYHESSSSEELQYMKKSNNVKRHSEHKTALYGLQLRQSSKEMTNNFEEKNKYQSEETADSSFLQELIDNIFININNESNELSFHDNVSFIDDNVPSIDDNVPLIDFIPTFPLNESRRFPKTEESKEESDPNFVREKSHSKEASVVSLTENNMVEKKENMKNSTNTKKFKKESKHKSIGKDLSVEISKTDDLNKSNTKKRKNPKGQKVKKVTNSQQNNSYQEQKNIDNKEVESSTEILTKKKSKIKEKNNTLLQSSDKEAFGRNESTSSTMLYQEGNGGSLDTVLEIRHNQDFKQYSGTETDSFKSSSGNSNIVMTSESEQTMRSRDSQKNAIIHFVNIPCHKPTKTTFVIRNETPILSGFTVTVQNFYENQNVLNKKMMEKIQTKREGKQRAEWNCRIQNNAGIVFVAEPTSAILEPKEVALVDIWVYADTWGTYCDQIVCEVGGLPEFYIQLQAEVTGFPLSFPMADGGLMKETLLRFGALAYRGPPQMRRMRIRNESSIRVNIYWHIFTEDDNNNTHDPFNIILDIFTPLQLEKIDNCNKFTNEILFKKLIQNEKQDSIMEMNIVPYYGKEDLRIFQIRPRFVSIPARGEATFVVKVNPIVCNPEESTCIKAVAVGYIKLAPFNRMAEELFYRPSGLDMKPVTFHMAATVEIPKLELHLIKGDLSFSIKATDVMNAANESYTIYQSLTFHNNCQAPLNAQVQTDKPFKIVKIKTKDNKLTSNRKVYVLSGQCAEIILECTLNSWHIEEALFFLKGKSNNHPEFNYSREREVILERDLSFTQPSVIKQIAKLQVNIVFPSLHLKTDLIDFGPVYLMDTRRMILTIQNNSGFEVFINLRKKQNSEEFTIVPNHATLPAAYTGPKNITDIEIYFTPSDTTSYQDKLVVETCISDDWQEVTLLGVGSLNARFSTIG